MRRGTGALMAGLIGLAGATVIYPGQATADEPDTPCKAEVFIYLDPGVGLEPASGEFTSRGEEGTVNCEGVVGGKQVTGEGMGGTEGTYGVGSPNSCTQLSGVAEFDLFATFPGKNGDVKFSDSVTGQYGPGQQNWLLGGTFTGEKSYGNFRFTPAEGNCFFAPVTRILVQADVWLVNGAPDAAAESRMALPD